MRRKFWLGLAIVTAVSSSSLAAQSSCWGNHCSLRLSANATVLTVSMPAVARVSVEQSRSGGTVTAWGNTRLVLQAQQDSASSQPLTIATAAVPTSQSRSLDLPEGAGQPVRYTATAP